MCGPAAVALVVSAAASGGAAYQQKENQRRTINYQNRVTEVTGQNAAKAAAASYVALAEQQRQIRQAASQEAFEAASAARSAASELAVRSEAAGIYESTGDLRALIAQRAAQDAAVRARNLDWQEAQILRQMEEVSARQQSRVNQTIGPPVPGIDYAGLLSGVGSAIFGYASTRSRNPEP